LYDAEKETYDDNVTNINPLYAGCVSEQFAKINVSARKRERLLSIINEYYSCKYFHVDPKRYLFDFLSEMMETDIVKAQLSSDKIKSLNRTMTSYYGSTPHFHVRPRRELLDTVENILKTSCNFK
jgi:hypothetical protein